MIKKLVSEALDKNLGSAVKLLEILIKFPSVRGHEKEIGLFLKPIFEKLADTAELVEIPDSLQDDPDYSFRLANFSYAGAANLRVALLGTGQGRKLAFNTHLDVVPPAPGQADPFTARASGGNIYGRGACDAKGQIAVLWLVLNTLRDLGQKPGGDVIIDFVVEEECGGNGTLHVVRNGLAADGAVVLEPTDLQVVHLVRGAVWFEIVAKGKAGHSGSPESAVSAIKNAVKAMEAVEQIREEILRVSRSAIPKLANHPNPMPCTFGMLHSGNWPASAPSEAVVKGVFGFLPPFKRKDVQDKLAGALQPHSADVKFNMLRSDPSYVAEDHPLVLAMVEAAKESGIYSRPAFMNASCDSWRYVEQLGIPAVVFGPGSIATAHSEEEHIAVDDIKSAALALILLIHAWSGLNHE